MSIPISPGIQECATIQIIEPDSDLPVGTGSIGADPALTERGEVVLSTGQSEAVVTFAFPKLTASYRFEYLYVDALGELAPGVITAVPVTMTTLGFTVEMAGEPPKDGYILRWRVVVVSVETTTNVDAPEHLRVQMPYHVGDEPTVTVLTVPFTNPRSNTNYGFSELRVENLVDAPEDQVPVVVQVYDKELGQFKITFSPDLTTPNYYLVVRTP